MMTKKIRSYSELSKLKTFEERFEYLKLNGIVGEETFGYERFLNQALYRSKIWRNQIRPFVITRDQGCDLGILDREIPDIIVIHHMNPITIEDIENDNPEIYDPEFLISSSSMTHKAIHYGDSNLLIKDFEPRFHGDTKLW